MNRHSMTVNGKDEGVTARDLMAVARRYDLRAAESYISRVRDVVLNYAEYARKAGVPDVWTGLIEAEIAARVQRLEM